MSRINYYLDAPPLEGPGRARMIRNLGGPAAAEALRQRVVAEQQAWLERIRGELGTPQQPRDRRSYRGYPR